MDGPSPSGSREVPPLTIPHLARRTVDVFRQRGLVGVALQSWRRIRRWFEATTFRSHVIDKTLAGHTMRVAINNLFAKGWVEQRLDWPELEWVAKHLVHPGDAVVDCGANNGFTAVFFAKCVGHRGRVIAFEPLPGNAEDIRQNIRLNSLDNVDLRLTAVGRASGRVMMLDTPNGIVSAAASERTISVAITSLDEALQGILPSFMKIDVEGHELEVLAGAQRVLALRPSLDIEVHPLFHRDRKRHVEMLVSELDKLGYEYSVQPVPDGPIHRWDRAVLPVASLAEPDVFHLFAYRPGNPRDR